MTIRRYTWAEFHAWRQVAARMARSARYEAFIDARAAVKGSDEQVKAHAEELRGHP